MRISDGIRNRIKRNGLFVLIAIVFLVGFMIRDSHLEASLVSHPDDELIFSTEDGILEQTWAPYMKNITGISVPFNHKCDGVHRRLWTGGRKLYALLSVDRRAAGGTYLFGLFLKG